LTRRRDSPTILPQHPSASPFDEITFHARAREYVLPASLTVSIVTYRPNRALLERCLDTLGVAIAAARADGAVGTVNVALIENSQDRGIAEAVGKLGNERLRDSGARMTLVQGHANIGYGAANNLALHGTGADYQLVMNPDIELAPDALIHAVRWLDGQPEIGAIAAAVTDESGTPLFLCRRYPAVFDLALRGFAPSALRNLFRKRLDRYELRDRIDPASREPVRDVPLLSGACVFVRRSAIDATGGFDPKFFLYFEDYDWSVRLARVTRTAYLPAMRAVHHGGRAASKGWRHIAWFARSAARFYGKHGWRWL
jgi:GT2 family glycosyltransferase